MSDRQRIRVGRAATYFPTDAEATAGGGSAGDQWAAIITRVLSDGAVNLTVFEADGTLLAKTNVEEGGRKGSFAVVGQLVG